VVVNVQGDEPLLSPDAIRLVADALTTHERAGVATLATPIHGREDLFNPNVVKVVLDAGGFAAYFSRAPIPWFRDAFGRSTPPAGPLPAGLGPLRHVGIYAYRVSDLLTMARHPPVAVEQAEALEQLRALWLQIRLHVTVVEEAPPHGVDTEEDLERIQVLLSQANFDR
jgi:3-deoxy-manno-octulosonate cytidylyltransferase (CMP-KDO synthetase)